jgi:NAD(P) transhydrogenase
MDAFDFVVIGAGPAGEKAATQAAYYGKKVAIVERRPDPGGIAVSDAGIPTKTLRETAQYLTGFRHRDIYGIGLALDASLKLERMKARTSEVRRTMTEAVRGNLQRMNVTFIHGEGKLLPGKRVVVDDKRVLDAQAILIATGSRPFHPPIMPWDDARICDSERILSLEKLPRSLCVVGGGAIGCEYASIFCALGVDVTLVEVAPRILPFADAELAADLCTAFAKYGVRVRLNAGLKSVESKGAVLQVALTDGSPIEVEHLLFAGGRQGNTENLGLKEAGVEVDAKGRVVVDGEYRTTAPGIFAAGDVIGPPGLASVSQEQGRVAACRAFGISFKHAVDSVPPFGVYSIPELAMAGLTEEAARAQGLDVEVGRGRFAKNTRARIAGATEGMVKLVFRRSDRVVVGVHILGDIASELVHIGQHAVADGDQIDRFIHHTFNVPTFSEAYKYAAYDGLQRLG